MGNREFNRVWSLRCRDSRGKGEQGSLSSRELIEIYSPDLYSPPDQKELLKTLAYVHRQKLQQDMPHISSLKKPLSDVNTFPSCLHDGQNPEGYGPYSCDACNPQTSNSETYDYDVIALLKLYFR